MGHLGDHVQAAMHFKEALSLAQVAVKTFDLAVCLLGTAGVQRSPRRAAQFLAAAQTIFEMSDWVIGPLYQAEIGRIEKAARAALSEADFAAVFAEGKTIPVDQAIAIALSESDDWVDGDITSFGWGLAEPTAADGAE
jgi:hypothetical protein